jgi:hypothetical protein
VPDPTSDVPVFVDSVIGLPEFPFVRVNYLAIERDEPDPRWRLGVGGQLLPMLLLNIEAIVMQPPGATAFARFDLIESTFAAIESDAGFTIQPSDVWFPSFLFRRNSIDAGDVYRVGIELFTDAFRYRNGAIDRATFLGTAERLGETLTFSAEETSAFRSCHTAMLEGAAAQFPNDQTLALPPREAQQ